MTSPKNLFVLICLALFLYVSFPFLISVLLGALFAILFYPWRVELESRNWPTKFSALILTVGISTLLILPLSFLIYSVARSGLTQLRSLILAEQRSQKAVNVSLIEDFLSSSEVQSFFEKVDRWFPVDTQELLRVSQEILTTIALTMADGLRNFFAELPGLLVGGAVVIVTIYFLLADAERMLSFIKRVSIFNPRQTQQFCQRAALMCRSVIFASVISATIQAAVFWVVLASYQVPHQLWITTLVFLFSFIPLVGSMPVTFSVALFIWVSGNGLDALVILCFGLVVTVLDNFIRPLVIKGASNLHPLIAFVTAFGGLQMLGLPGVFFGPIIAGIFLAGLDTIKPVASR